MSDGSVINLNIVGEYLKETRSINASSNLDNIIKIPDSIIISTKEIKMDEKSRPMSKKNFGSDDGKQSCTTNSKYDHYLSKFGEFISALGIKNEEEILAMYHDADRRRNQKEFFIELKALLEKYNVTITAEFMHGEYFNTYNSITFTSPNWNSFTVNKCTDRSEKYSFTNNHCDTLIKEL